MSAVRLMQTSPQINRFKLNQFSEFKMARVAMIFILGMASSIAHARPDGYTLTVEGTKNESGIERFSVFACGFPSQAELDDFCKEKELMNCRVTNSVAHQCNPRKQKCYC